MSPRLEGVNMKKECVKYTSQMPFSFSIKLSLSYYTPFTIYLLHLIPIT